MKPVITLAILAVLTLNISLSMAQKFENLAQTPPMGWNSWNKFGCNVSEDLIKEIADVMVESGMYEAGYEYLVIDDCWQIARDSAGNIIPDPERFPSGIKALADYIHSKGLKLGIYSDAGTATCEGRPGSRGYEYQDARTYASWGIDYLKYDWCNTKNQSAKASYQLMRDAIYAAGRPMVFSICEWGANHPWEWAQDVGHLWRTTGDIQDCWDCKVNWGALGWIHILDKQVDLETHAGPGHWNDADMLEVGNGAMTNTEDRAHFTMWCMLASPLMAGNDIRNMSDETKAILTHKPIITINQDELGKQGFRVLQFDNIDVWVKPLANDELAVCFLNRGNEDYELNFDWQKFNVVDKSDWSKVKWKEKYHITDVWTGKNLGKNNKVLKSTIPSHDVLLIRLTK